MFKKKSSRYGESEFGSERSFSERPFHDRHENSGRKRSSGSFSERPARFGNRSETGSRFNNNRSENNRNENENDDRFVKNNDRSFGRYESDSDFKDTRRENRGESRGENRSESFPSRRRSNGHGSFGGGGSSFPRRRTGGSFEGSGRSGGGSGRRRFKEVKIDNARFVNKMVLTQDTEAVVLKHTFEDFGLDIRLNKAIADKGYEQPTPIQDQTIVQLMQGVDCVGIADTGTGKTAAFLLPLLNKIIKNKTEQGIIIVPTRELALQIDEECKSFAKGLGIWSVCCIGGASLFGQIGQLKRKSNIIIGTPGRLKDLVKRGTLRMSVFSTVILDEADRMLDMGFIDDVKELLSQTSEQRQTILFSATLSREIESLVSGFLKNPIKVSIKTRDTSGAVEQDVISVKSGESKIEKLCGLLQDSSFEKVLIFGKTKHGVEKLSEILTDRSFKVTSIHGDKNHSKRQRALESFKKGRVSILVATDVAARGLDIAGITHVINYDIPATYEDYVHRIGRTGRGGKTGKAFTFVDNKY